MNLTVTVLKDDKSDPRGEFLGYALLSQFGDLPILGGEKITALKEGSESLEEGEVQEYTATKNIVMVGHSDPLTVPDDCTIMSPIPQYEPPNLLNRFKQAL